MKKEDLLTLIKKLKEYKIPDDIVVNLFNQKEDLLNELKDLNEPKSRVAINLFQRYLTTDYDIVEIIKILEQSKYYKKTLDFLCNYYAIEEGMTIEGAKLILQARAEQYADCVLNVLCNGHDNDTPIAIEGAKLVLQAETEKLAHSVSLALWDSILNKAGVAIEAAKLILQSQTGN